MQCNIDQRGREVRRNGGILCLVLAAASFGAAYFGVARGVFLSVGAGLIFCGLFHLFQARNGWCAARAMGFNTRV
jgi:hypothetical protein